MIKKRKIFHIYGKIAIFIKFINNNLYTFIYIYEKFGKDYKLEIIDFK